MYTRTLLVKPAERFNQDLFKSAEYKINQNVLTHSFSSRFCVWFISDVLLTLAHFIGALRWHFPCKVADNRSPAFVFQSPISSPANATLSRALSLACLGPALSFSKRVLATNLPNNTQLYKEWQKRSERRIKNKYGIAAGELLEEGNSMKWSISFVYFPARGKLPKDWHKSPSSTSISGILRDRASFPSWFPRRIVT